MTHIAYIRVSTLEQNTDRQLVDTGIQFDEVFTDKCSGSSTKRNALAELIRYARKGDTVHVHSIDRLARDLRDLQGLVKGWLNKGIGIQFHKEGLHFTSDTTNPMNDLLLNMLGAVAQFELATIKERQAEGIAKAKAKGKYTGRKVNTELHQKIKDSIENGISIRRTAFACGCSISTVQTVKKGI